MTYSTFKAQIDKLVQERGISEFNDLRSSEKDELIFHYLASVDSDAHELFVEQVDMTQMAMNLLSGIEDQSTFVAEFKDRLYESVEKSMNQYIDASHQKNFGVKLKDIFTPSFSY